MESKRKPIESKETKPITLDQNLTLAEKKHLDISLSTCREHGEWYACGDGLIAQSAIYEQSSIVPKFFRKALPPVSIIRLYDLENETFLTPFIPKTFKDKSNFETLGTRPEGSINLLSFESLYDDKANSYKHETGNFYLSKNKNGNVTVVKKSESAWNRGIPNLIFQMQANNKKFDSGTETYPGYLPDHFLPIICFPDDKHFCFYTSHPATVEVVDIETKKVAPENRIQFGSENDNATSIVPSYNGKFFYVYQYRSQTYEVYELANKNTAFSKEKIGEIPGKLFENCIQPPLLSPTGLVLFARNDNTLNVYNPRTRFLYSIDVTIPHVDRLAFPDEESFALIHQNQLTKFPLARPGVELEIEKSTSGMFNKDVTKLILSYAGLEFVSEQPKKELNENVGSDEKNQEIKIDYSAEMKKLQIFTTELSTHINLLSEHSTFEKWINHMEKMSENISADDLDLMRSRILKEINILKEKLEKIGTPQTQEALHKLLTFLNIDPMTQTENIKWSQIHEKIDNYRKDVDDARPK